MMFKIPMRPIFYFLFALLGIIGFYPLILGLFFLINFMILYAVWAILLGLAATTVSGKFLFFHNIQICTDSIIINFGPFYINKKIYYKDIDNIRYADKSDYIVHGQPVSGRLCDTIAITFLNGETMFISIKNVQTFYQRLLELNCKEDLSITK